MNKYSTDSEVAVSDEKSYLEKTSAGRLVRILAGVPGMDIPDNTIFSCWIKLFDLSTESTEEALQSAVKALALADRVNSQMNELGIDRDLYSATCAGLRRAFNDGLRGGLHFKAFKDQVSSERIEVLKWCALFLEQKGKVFSQSQESIERLKELTHTLLDELSSFEGPDEALAKLKSALQAVLEAIHDFELFGIDGVTDAIVKTAAEAALAKQILVESGDVKVQKSIMIYLKDASAILGGINAARQLFESTTAILPH